MPKLMVKSWFLFLAAAALGPTLALAQRASTDDKVYAISALGFGTTMQDCGHRQACPAYDAAAGKLGVGVRLGAVATEVWGLHFGRSKPAPGGFAQQLQAVVMQAAWTLPFAPNVYGVLRAGGGTLTQARPDGSRRLVLAAAYGAAVVFHATPWLALEVAWDMVTADGEGTRAVLGQMGTAGVRLSF
jgi:hypothetical protein